MKNEWCVRSSRKLIAVVLLFYGAAFLAVLFSPIPFGYKVLLDLALGLDSVRLVYFKLIRESPTSIVKFRFIDRAWYLIDRVGRDYAVNLLKSSVVLAPCVILNFRMKGRWRFFSFVIFESTFREKEDFRRLKFFLRSFSG